MNMGWEKPSHGKHNGFWKTYLKRQIKYQSPEAPPIFFEMDDDAMLMWRWWAVLARAIQPECIVPL